MVSKIYVHAPTAEGHLLAGRATWADKLGTFEYAPDWLASADAYALDPRNLPLVERVFVTRANEGVFGVLADAGPDAWGRRVIEQRHRQKPANPLEYLVSGNGDGVGALRFSLSRSKVGPLPNHLALDRADLQLVADAEHDLDAGLILDDARLRRVWEAGSSMGGARPKFTAGDGDDTWLVKLARRDDTVNMARLEHACLVVARQAGLTVPDSRVATLGTQTALFVRRFDRGATDTRHHYLSAHALLNQPKVGAADVTAPMGVCTYGGLAALAQRSLGLSAGPELFERMVFNLLLGNTDDHGRNLGFLKVQGRPWQLAPAFDLTVVGGPLHALGLGTHGREASLANALSALGQFQVSPDQAQATVVRLQAAVATLPTMLRQLGATPVDVAWAAQRLPMLAAPVGPIEDTRSHRRLR